MKTVLSNTGKKIKIKVTGSLTHIFYPDKPVVVSEDHLDLLQERLGNQIKIEDRDTAPEPEVNQDEQDEEVIPEETTEPAPEEN